MTTMDRSHFLIAAAVTTTTAAAETRPEIAFTSDDAKAARYPGEDDIYEIPKMDALGL